MSKKPKWKLLVELTIAERMDEALALALEMAIESGDTAGAWDLRRAIEARQLVSNGAEDVAGARIRRRIAPADRKAANSARLHGSGMGV